MNINYISRFINEQISSINDPDAPETGEMVLMLSSFLLEQIKEDPSVFANAADERALNRTFRHCSKNARLLGEFSDKYGETISQKAQTTLNAIKENDKKLTKVQQDCDTYEASIKELQTKIKQLESQNGEMLAMKDDLEALSNEYSNLSGVIAHYQKIQSEITEDILSSMKTQISETEPEIQRLQKEYNDLHSRTESLSEQLAEFHQLIESSKEKEALLQKDIGEKNTQLDELKKNISNYTQQAQELTLEIDSAGKEYEELQEIIDANNKISDAIRNSGYILTDKTSRDSFYVHIDKLKERAQAIENEYDDILKHVLADARKLLADLSKRQKP